VTIKDVLSAGLPEQVELDEEVRAVVADFFANPSHRVPVAVGPDDCDLEDPDEAEAIAGLVTEYVSADFTERQWSASSEVLPHRRVPENAIVVDYDGVAADLDYEAAGLPEPTKLLANPENGHGHLWWIVAGEFASPKARRWMRDIQRGYTRRLSGDRAYVMVYTKNPDYPGWQVSGSGVLYSLRQLDAVLLPAEKFKDWRTRRLVSTAGTWRSSTSCGSTPIKAITPLRLTAFPILWKWLNSLASWGCRTVRFLRSVGLSLGTC
jgi:Replicase family